MRVMFCSSTRMQLLRRNHQCLLYFGRTVTAQTNRAGTPISLVIRTFAVFRPFCTRAGRGTPSHFQDYRGAANHEITAKGIGEDEISTVQIVLRVRVDSYPDPAGGAVHRTPVGDPL